LHLAAHERVASLMVCVSSIVDELCQVPLTSVTHCLLLPHPQPHSFLPDKAIDLIDEAGSRVRLRHIQLPEEARDLDKELKQVQSTL